MGKYITSSGIPTDNLKCKVKCSDLYSKFQSDLMKSYGLMRADFLGTLNDISNKNLFFTKMFYDDICAVKTINQFYLVFSEFKREIENEGKNSNNNFFK